jgi:hypothetical protein
MPQVPLRVDGDEVYTTELPCELVGNLIGNELRMLDGLTPYYFEE